MEEFDDTNLLTIPSGAHSIWWRPSHSMWFEVLQRAIERYLKLLGLEKHTVRQQKELVELNTWIFSEDDWWVGSFICICDNCHIDVDKVRTRIREYLELRAMEVREYAE